MASATSRKAVSCSFDAQGIEVSLDLAPEHDDTGDRDARVALHRAFGVTERAAFLANLPESTGGHGLYDNAVQVHALLVHVSRNGCVS